ncbi:hypothetical protein K2173_017292 [Erythroxylum novogranatense]|uniref:DYW domain-containing protein n=1 Tax=Erythroxylum novogranatense TaxID=1862640 RepID=A0AAV8U9P6_9ROSI|nr:hypothetical protein K2173_017292 [Erythroxylum novogranatense]
MFRGFLRSTYRKSRCTSFTTLTASLSLPPPSYQSSHIIGTQNFNSFIHLSFSNVLLPNLVSHYKWSQSCIELPPLLPPDRASDDFDVYEHLVQSYKNSSCLNDSKLFHLKIIKHGFDFDLFLSNTLINVYVRALDLRSARKLFDEMSVKNTVTWACLISGYIKNAMPEEAVNVFKVMISEGVMPNHFAFGSALRACLVSALCGLKLGMQIHGMILKSQYANHVALCNALISMYGSYLGYLDYASRVFYETEIRNSISWNSIISVYSQTGDAVSAFSLFSSMQTETSGFILKPNEYTYGSLIIAACSSIDYGLCLLEQMLTRIEKSGLISDLYVGSALVSGFARCGLLDYAKKIFEQMNVKNAVCLNGLMVGLVRQKHGKGAAEIFVKMRSVIDIPSDSYIILLSSFAEFSILEEGRRKGREVHGYLIRSGLSDVKIAIGNGLINMYAKCSSINDARLVFRLMVDKDSVSWNSMISGLDQNECFEDAVETYYAMRKTGLMPSNFSLISVLSSCGSLGWVMLGQQTHGEGLKLGLDLDVSVSNALLSLYGETGYHVECQKLFALMLEYDQVSWNTIIGSLVNSEFSVSETVQVFLNMMRGGWTPNRVTFICILGAVSLHSLSELSHQLHALMLKYHIMDESAVENALLACYGKCGEMSECEKIFSRMSDRRDNVSWNSMISGYIHSELLSEAMDIVWFMMQRGQQLDSFTFATVLSACASVATLERGMEVHACAIRACLESDVVIGSALVDMYSKCGKIDYASKTFYSMPFRNVYSWNSLISGYARHGLGNKALKLFAKMKHDGQFPDHVTFVAVLSACSHVGLLDEGFEHFKAMTKVYGLYPLIEHYSCMVDLLGRAGRLDKIESFISTMPMKPNVLIWRTVLGACCRVNGRKTELGQKAAAMLFQMEPQNAVNYVLLSNMYASGGKWDDMEKARAAMRDTAAKKEAGCSWVTMKDGVHVFVAGDNLHPQKDAIYEQLKELNAKLRNAGYVPQTNFAFYDLDQESKEEILSYHSEKIAVAFVLTRNSGLPIRIMKNLRVCGDCHTAFKYISLIVGRQIILRDSVRFHHFEDGGCSCGDYW